MQRLGIVNATALTLAFAALAATPLLFARAAGPPKGDPALGKPLFARNCTVCHKADGTGGMKLTGNPTPNWKDPKTWADPKRAKDEFFRNCIVNGNIKSGMVAWGKQLKPAEIEHLIAYIRSFAPAK